MNKGQLNLLIDYAFEFLLESESVKAAGVTKKDISAGGQNKVVSLIRGVVARIVVETLEYDKKTLCPYFGDCSPANVYLIARNANNLYEADSSLGKNFKEMTDATLAAVIKKFGALDEIKFKDGEGAGSAGDDSPTNNKSRGKRVKKVKKKTRGPYRKRGDNIDDLKDKLAQVSSRVTSRAEFVIDGEVQPMIALLIYSYLQTNPELKVKDLADAFGLSVAVVEHAVCNVLLELRDAAASSPEAVCIKAGIERLRVLTAGPKKK